MSPALTNHRGDYPEFGLYWEEKYGDKARPVVETSGAVNFDSEKDVELTVGGNEFSLHPAMKQNAYQNDYAISKEQILQISNGKEGVYRLHPLMPYVDVDVSHGYQGIKTYTPKPFRNCYKTAWGNS